MLLIACNFRIPEDPQASPSLLGGRCTACGTVIFPTMPVCPNCHRNATVEMVEIGRSGRLYSHTIAWVAPKGFVAPFYQVFIDLAEGPRIFSLVGSDCPVRPGTLHDEMEMRLIIEPLADTPDNRDVLSYKYLPVSGPSSAAGGTP